MKTWFVSRHPGALHWMQRNHIMFDVHVTHLDITQVRTGDKVMGSLPINLAADICARGAQYWHLSLHLPANARGQELDADTLDCYQAKLEPYAIQRLS